MAVMEGSLSKWTNVMKGWQYRWFVLDDNSGLLTYYTSKEKMMRGARRGCVRLKGAVIGIDDEDDSTFTITVDHKTFHFQARDAEEREKWVRALEDTIFRHGSRMMWDSHRPPPTIKDFDNKVSEADAYLQLMIEQTKKLEDTLETMSDGDDKNKCQVIASHANTMLDNIKHSIVLLQIAKNTAHPINGVYQPKQGPSSLNISPNDEPSRIGELEIVQSGIELGAECLEGTRRISRPLGFQPTAGLIVPAMSYSSSEGEDDFFDANDSPYTPGSLVQTPTSATIDDEAHSLSSAGAYATKSGHAERGSVSSSRRASGKRKSIVNASRIIDYDALYEDNDEDSVEMESHGSVIRHLLAQVKIGMDLTKVVLPTFILERRSLLEMYADYFAHPDMFLKIADLKEPQERMLQVVKWYLSSFHAGRNSAVAKKPYNPILGEVFRCHWDVPATPKGASVPHHAHGPVGQEGPVPWCDKSQLTFVAEQVSHHPPISAFYAEHVDKRIQFNAHVYTKSKFLGLSVCVNNIGEGVVSVLDYGEDYVVTFPNGYGRSILTVPWIELGGPVNITCEKTGYSCHIEFLTKPFYGNKKHKITAEVLGPDDPKKPIVTIAGEWNSVMEAKWADGETTVFTDIHKLTILKKQVRPIAQQEENESRRLWKEVTAGLKFNDIEKATNAKQELEQKQREEARIRKETNTTWETQLFSRMGTTEEEGWIYKTPLKNRVGSHGWPRKSSSN